MTSHKPKDFHCIEGHFVPDVLFDADGYWCGDCGRYYDEEELRQGPPMPDEKQAEPLTEDYRDIDGKPCSLFKLIREEPVWAENILRGTRARVVELEAENTILRELVRGAYGIMSTRGYATTWCEKADTALLPTKEG